MTFCSTFLSAFEFCVFAGAGLDSIDLVALECPEVQQAQFFLFVRSQPFQLFAESLASLRMLRETLESSSPAGAYSSSRSLWVGGGEEELLLVLAMNVAQRTAPIAGGRRWSRGDWQRKHAIFHRPRSRAPRSVLSARSCSMPASRRNFEFVAYFRQRKCPRPAPFDSPPRIMSDEARAPNSRLRESTTIDLPLPVSPVRTFKPLLKANASLLHDSIVLDYQLQQHVTGLYVFIRFCLKSLDEPPARRNPIMVTK